MPKLSVIQRDVVRVVSRLTLRRLLSFHVAFSGLIYVHDDVTTNWRELEAELHVNYPIKGVGVKATHANLRRIDEDDGGFLHSSEDLHPGDVPAELGSFPYEAAAAAYAFTLLEGYGDALVKIVNPGYLKARQSWHNGVYGDINLNEKAALAKAREGFTKPFACPVGRIRRFEVQRLVELKAVRNEVMHEGTTQVDFVSFFGKVIGTIGSIYFLLLPSDPMLSEYPYQDYHEKWS